MNYKLVFSQIGRLLIIIGLTMLVPVFFALIDQDQSLYAFLVGFLVFISTGLALYFGCRNSKNFMQIRDGFMLVTFAWIISSVLGSIPLILSGYCPHVVDAFFETVSGFTTTGSTIFDDIESLPRSILIWRSLMHWLGGMGIVVLFVALLSGLGTGGMYLFKAEVTGPLKEKIRPRISDSAKSLWFIYLILTGLSTIAFKICGMSWFDAVNHGMSAIATGGFSTRSASIAAFQNPAIEWVAILFMFLSGISFAAYYMMWRKKTLQVLTRNHEVRLYLSIVLFAGFCATFSLVARDDFAFLDALRSALFGVVATITTTGFVSADYETWNYFARSIVLFLLFTGACAGSTAGGIKLQRILILLKQTKNELQYILHPRMVTSLKINGTVVPNRIITNVAIYIFLYFLLVVAGTILGCSFNLSFLEAFTSSLSSMGNVGPSFGAFGPTESFSSMPSPVKIFNCMQMLIGRLEIYTVLVVVLPLGHKRMIKND